MVWYSRKKKKKRKREKENCRKELIGYYKSLSFIRMKKNGDPTLYIGASFLFGEQAKITADTGINKTENI
jgi:hypothetical protein